MKKVWIILETTWRVGDKARSRVYEVWDDEGEAYARTKRLNVDMRFEQGCHAPAFEVWVYVVRSKGHETTA